MHEADYRRLKASWGAGSHEREGALHLLYLAWMHWADPLFVSGMEEDPDAIELWLAISTYFGGENSEDAEFLHVAGLMASITPEELGDGWLSRAERMTARSLQLNPKGFLPELFEGRGLYGEYFAHQARRRPWDS